MLTFSPNGHGMGVYEEMRVHAVQACTHLRMLALVQPVADFHRLTRRETRERWRHHGSTDTVCTIGLRTGAVCVCVCGQSRAASKPRGLQCHVTRSERSQLSLHCRVGQPLQYPPHTCRPSRCTCLHQWNGRGRLCRTEPSPSTEAAGVLDVALRAVQCGPKSLWRGQTRTAQCCIKCNKSAKARACCGGLMTMWGFVQPVGHTQQVQRKC
jgi:hypothetical protein